MNEIGQSIAESIRKRAVSSALGTYLFFWCAIHWEGIYTTVFTNQDLILQKYGMLKNEYVEHYFFGWNGLNTVVAFTVPIILTAVFIWIVPRFILVHAYRQEQRHRVEKLTIKYEEDEKLQAARTVLAKQQKKATEAEVDASIAIKNASKSDPTILWQQEMIDFLKIEKSITTLKSLKRVIYQDGGHLSRYLDPDGNEWIDATGLNLDQLALADTNDLIIFDSEERTIQLTKKGKFFLSKFEAAPQSLASSA